VVNDASKLSRDIGQYYAGKRGVPPRNVCHIRTIETETIPREQYDREISSMITACLVRNNLTEQILYIVTTGGIPLRIAPTASSGAEMEADNTAMDSELALLYSDMKQGIRARLKGPALNPFLASGTRYPPAVSDLLVTRLAAYDLAGVRALIDRALHAANQGKFVIDLKSADNQEGNSWLRQAANMLPKDRVILDASDTVLYDQTAVIAYAGWGSNDRNRHRRFLGFHWLPGGIATEFVSTNARTFKRPPDNWNISDWKSEIVVRRSPQTLTADFLERTRYRSVTSLSCHDAASGIPLPRITRTKSGGELLLSIRSLSWRTS
jgi:uncharacterized protein (TIGR03790 family)